MAVKQLANLGKTRLLFILIYLLQIINAVFLQLPQDISVEEARILLMVKLFKTGKLSIGQAADLAGYSKPTF